MLMHCLLGWQDPRDLVFNRTDETRFKMEQRDLLGRVIPANEKYGSDVSLPVLPSRCCVMVLTRCAAGVAPNTPRRRTVYGNHIRSRREHVQWAVLPGEARRRAARDAGKRA